MKRAIRFLVAGVLTLLLLIIARQLSMVRPVEMKSSAGKITAQHISVPKVVEGKPDSISIKIDNPEMKDLQVFLHISHDPQIPHSQYTSVEMAPAQNSIYAVSIPILPRGGKIYYYIDIALPDNGEIIRIPAIGASPIKVKYEGHVPAYIVIPHIFLMFVTIFFASLALIDALNVLSNASRLVSMAKNFRWATTAVFFGGFPFGWGMNYFAFGVVWEGIPFGWDFTDNKTQIVLLYLIFLNLSMLGSLYNNRFGGNNFSDKALGRLSIVGYLLVVAIYIIPHSIQFSIPTTALFSYGLTAGIAALYISGLTRGKRWTEKKLQG
jgi:hypothetical protein